MLESPPPRREIEPDPLPLALRAATLGIIAAILLGVLVTRLWALQILHADQYVQAATQQTVRYTTLPAERGMIVDANGVAMVKSSGTLGVQLNPGTLPQPINCDGITKNHREKLKDEPGCAVMFRLADVLQIPFNGPEGIVSQYWYGQRQNHGHPVAITATVTKSEVEYVTERMNQYRGVEFFSTYQRQYEKAANDSANILGHVGPITADWLKSRFNDPKYLPRTGTIGQNGLELTYDRELRGTDGKVAQTFNASGNPQGRSYLQAPAQQGDTLKLTINNQLQQVAEKAIQHGISVAHTTGSPYADAGAIVAIDPDTGAILAQASYPTYDPSIWVPPYKGQAAVLHADKVAGKTDPSPLSDLAAEGNFPAGSTFKPFTAAAAYATGILAPGSELDCSSYFQSPKNHDLSQHKFNNFGAAAGMIGLPEALTISCDTFFYRVGDAFYGKYLDDHHNEQFQKTLREFGYGRAPQGYDLLSSSGLIPTAKWKRTWACNQQGPKKNGYTNSCGNIVTPDGLKVQPYNSTTKSIAQEWNPGDDINMAIGQGYVEVTPLQEAVAYSAIANGGKLVRPHVVGSILDPANDGAVIQKESTKPVRNLHLNPSYLQEVIDGLHGATHDSTGTSSAVFSNYTGTPFDVWGKTGTAQTNADPTSPDDAWWSGWAENAAGKKIVVVAMIHKGGHGGVSAAPAALEVFQKFFGQKVTGVNPSSSADTSR